MTFLEPVSIESDPGDSFEPAPAEHSHKLFDNGLVLPLRSGWSNTYAANPLRVYKAADWVFLNGIVSRTGPDDFGAIELADLPDLYKPNDETDRKIYKGAFQLPIPFTGIGGIKGFSFLQFYTWTVDSIEIFQPFNGDVYSLSLEWRTV